MDRIEEHVRKRFARKIKRGKGERGWSYGALKKMKQTPSLFDYIPVSCRSARKVLRDFGLNERIPRPGHERDLSPATRLVNWAGKCEFRFSQRDHLVTT